MASAITIATETRGPSRRAASSATASSPSCTLFLIVSWWLDSAGRLRSAASAAWAASAGKARRVAATSSSEARAASVSPSRPEVTMRLQHAVARGLRTGRVAVGAAALGQLRQRHQQRGFRDAEALRLLAEPGERGGAHALEIAAIGRQRQVALEDFLLGQPPLDLDGAEDLAEFLAEAAAFARLDQAGELHRQRRAARHDAAVAGELRRGAGKRDVVDAGVVEEALVLIGDQHLQKLRIDLVERGGEPPAPVRRRIGAQQAGRRGR